MKVHSVAAFSAGAALMLGVAVASAQAPQPATLPQADVSDVATLASATPRWVFVGGQNGTRIFDGDSGKMLGMIEVPMLANISLDPLGQRYFVAETIWTKLNRGTRQDMVTIYDSHSLKVLSEISVPGRLLGGTQLHNFAISSNGKVGFVYNLSPSSSVQVVDLDKKKLLETVQLPGCASLFPTGADGVAALCANGSMATIKPVAGKYTVTRSDPFFDAANDAIFDCTIVDRAKGVATFLTYSGKIYTATMGDGAPKISGGWSILGAAGLREGVAPPDINWLPGGRQPLAVHRPTGRIYVLMHMGEYWNHKEAGEEIWVLDGATHKLIGRHKTPGKVVNIQVSQDANPLVYVSGENEKTWVLEGDTFKTKHDIDRAGGGALYVVEPS